jgi:hypothetical protein
MSVLAGSYETRGRVVVLDVFEREKSGIPVEHYVFRRQENQVRELEKVPVSGNRSQEGGLYGDLWI